jgi:hypothetical protein
VVVASRRPGRASIDLKILFLLPQSSLEPERFHLVVAIVGGEHPGESDRVRTFAGSGLDRGVDPSGNAEAATGKSNKQNDRDDDRRDQNR